MIRFIARALGLAALLALGLGALVIVQLLRLRRMEFLPEHPGFWINHVVRPSGAESGVDSDARPLRLTVLGDSTTVGIGVRAAEASLPYRLAQLVADAMARPVHVASFGWSGARIGGVVADQLPRASQPLGGEAPDAPGFLATSEIVALVVGANDATHRTPATRFAHDLRIALDGIRREAPTARIVIAGVPRLRGALGNLAPLMLIADLIAGPLRRIQRREAARVAGGYADLAGEVPRLLRGRIDPDAVLAADQFHPGAEAYAVWAEVIAAALPAEAPEGRPPSTNALQPLLRDS